MNTFRRPAFVALFLSASAALILSPPPGARADTGSETGLADTLTFGMPASEQGHALTADGSDVVTGGLGEPARVLLPKSPQTWQGGSVAFTMKVDPVKPDYFTVRFWGSDTSPNRLILFCEGKQVGYIHIGDIDLLDFGNEDGGLPDNGRFFYNTTPLPEEMTKGRTELHFEIRSIGRVWGYGGTFDLFQKPMTGPTRGIYRAYTHTGGYFAPPADEKQGAAPSHVPVRSQPGPEVMDKLKDRVNRTIDGLLAADKPLGQMQMQFLARAYHVAWTHAYQNPKVVPLVTQGMDLLYATYRKDPQLVMSDPSTPNPDWFGAGPAGDAVWLLARQLAPDLDAAIDDGSGGKVSRRAAWAQVFRGSCDWESRHRRQYSNQSMIVDLNICLANNGLVVVDPSQALPRDRVLHYLYQSVGLEPWLGSETDHGPAKPLGDDYWELTSHGLTKELGFVGYYGEVLDWVTQIYDATRPALDEPGDPKIKAQLEKIARARAVFRYPALDTDGDRAMRAETIIGWRDAHYPGDVTYAERPTWDASALYAAAATLDPDLVGSAQQMFADSQFFALVAHQMAAASNLRVTAGLLAVPDQYETLKAQPTAPKRLPMGVEQPDFVFADEDDGVVAVKHGSEILYASLYWRARYGINFLARVHDITPSLDRIAVAREETEFTPSGAFYTRPDGIGGGAPGGVHYPADWRSAEAGERLPIARVPDGVPFKPGQENAYAGRGSFYTLRYGPYLIGMNTTTDRTFTLTIPTDAGAGQDLVTHRAAPGAGASVKVGPHSTAVFYFGEDVR